MTSGLSNVSTDSVDPSERLELWEAYNSRELIGLKCSSYQPEGLRASQINLDLGGVRVGRIEANAHVVDRSTQVAASMPKDSVFIAILLEGSGFFHDASGTRVLNAGDALLYNAGAPHLFGFDTAMRQHMLDIPRDLIGKAPREPMVIHRRSKLNTACVQLLSHRVQELLAGPPEPGTAREEMLLLVSSLLRDTEPQSSVVLRAAKTFIDGRLTDPDLTAEAVARTVSVSLRHLNRGFAAEGTTVTQYIQDRRLEVAWQELANAGKTTMRIADVAARWGFSSQAHFTRAFRRRYGLVPSQMRS